MCEKCDLRHVFVGENMTCKEAGTSGLCRLQGGENVAVWIVIFLPGCLFLS